VGLDSVPPSFHGLYCFAHCAVQNESLPVTVLGPFLALTQTEVCTSALIRGHNRADTCLRCVHDGDVVGGKQEGCGWDVFSRFILQRR
jgi:hypothetical protein